MVLDGCHSSRNNISRKVKHYLHTNQIIQAIHISSMKETTMAQAASVLAMYIYDTKGIQVPGIVPEPIEKFEEAVTTASSYFLMVNQKQFGGKATFMSIVVEMEDVDDVKQAMEDAGI